MEEAAIEAARAAELRERASKRDPERVQMSAAARTLLEELSPLVCVIDNDVLELAETKSVSYHGPGFFLEVLPRKHRLTLLWPLDFNEVEDPGGIARDASEFKFLFYANYEGGVTVSIGDSSDIPKALPLIHQVHLIANA